MFVPFISKPSNERLKKLYRRKVVSGGGNGDSGGGENDGSGGGENSGSGGGGKTGSGTSGGNSAGGSNSSAVGVDGSTRFAIAYGPGGGKAAAIPAGQPFAGRQEGGGTRNQVFGNQQYGSGYPGIAGRGVAGRGFPFFFWPVAWGGIPTLGASAYLHSYEYGAPNDDSRPGGMIAAAAFISSSGNTTYRLVSDFTTMVELIADIKANCSSSLNSSSSSIPSALAIISPFSPQPEQAIQYYRASSIALTLDGYNNTGALGPDGSPDTPLPTNIDRNLMDCLNQTIGLAAPLIDGASARWAVPNIGLVSLAWVLWWLSFT